MIHCALLLAAAAPQQYDLLVIGGGAAGLTAAKFAARFGKRVAIVEKGRFGGDCTWTGCVPSKALLASAARAHSLRTAGELGVRVGSVEIDFKAVRDRIALITQRIYEKDDSPEALRKLGIEAVEGAATFVDGRTLDVKPTAEGKASRELYATQGIVIATGAIAHRPPIPGLDEVPYLTYEEIFRLHTVPPRMTVVGGGPIGCELAQAFSRLGSKVTIVAPALLPALEPEVGASLSSAFEAEGIARVASRAASVSAGAAAAHSLVCEDGSRLEGEVLLVAAGRVPVVPPGLEFALTSTGGVRVDERLQTSVEGVLAAGDVTGERQFTHYAGFQGAIAARNALLPLSDAGVLGNGLARRRSPNTLCTCQCPYPALFSRSTAGSWLRLHFSRGRKGGPNARRGDQGARGRSGADTCPSDEQRRSGSLHGRGRARLHQASVPAGRDHPWRDGRGPVGG